MYKSAIYFFLLSFFFSQCGLNVKRGNGHIDFAEYELEDFEKIYIGGNYEVKLFPSDDNKVVIKTDENLFRYINVETYENALNINNVHNLKSSDGILVEVYYRNLNHIYSTGTSKIGHEGILATDELSIDLSGAGAIDLEIDTYLVAVEMSGAGVIILSGRADRQETHISGAGGMMAENLRSKECDINLSGLGGANVYVTEKLEATITGIGGITYAGNPELIEKRVTGLGKIERSNDYVENEEDIEQ
jgi:hypothetical protein